MRPLTIIKTSIVRPGIDHEWDNEIPKMARLRTPRIWQMAQIAVKRLLTDCSTPPQSIITATALGALDETKNYLDGVFKDGFGSPRNFIASVHNSMAGKLALDFDIEGPNLTVCDGQNSFASAMVTASLLTNADYPVLLVVVDEKIELLNTLLPHFSDNCREYLDKKWEEAAVAFLLDSSDGKTPCMSAIGPELTGDQTPEEKCTELADIKEYPLLTLSETSDSFLKPALVVYEIIAGSRKGNHAIGSYSPSAHAAAVVNLCV